MASPSHAVRSETTSAAAPVAAAAESERRSRRQQQPRARPEAATSVRRATPAICASCCAAASVSSSRHRESTLVVALVALVAAATGPLPSAAHVSPGSGGSGTGPHHHHPLVPTVLVFNSSPWSPIAAPQKVLKVLPPPTAATAPSLPPPAPLPALRPHCPETGKTVCANVVGYPEEHVFAMVRQTHARGFNFSSLFFDDREGFEEPQFERWIPPAQPSSSSPTYSVATVLLLQDQPHFPYSKASTSTTLISTPTHHQHQNPWWDLRHHIAKSTLKRRRKRNVASTTEPACETRQLYLSPKAALSDKNEWKFIVNVQERDPRIKQIIRAEICRAQDTSCSPSIRLPFGYISLCKQKYLKKKLLSLDIDGRGLSEENFFVPSCCVCELVRVSTLAGN